VRLKQQLDVDASAPRRARAMVDQLREELGQETVESVQLVLSELTTNCVLHGSADSAISVAVEWTGSDRVHLEVDCARGRSQPHIVRAGYRGGSGGLGLRLVDKVCADWGVRNQDGRTIVWADVVRAPSMQ
jgi:anti-sigma regulatory factor (Ser/Thr protein kinase)